MAALESPLEALAFNYLSFEFLTSVHTVWTIVAVITTAAVSVWRIRASSQTRVCCTDQPSPHLTWYPSSEPQTVTSSPVTASATESASPPLTALPAFESLGRTSGKFALYYQKYDEDDEGNDDVNNSNDGGGNEGDDVEVLHWVEDSYNGIMKIRMRDMGWYRYQDLKVLDGSVVRLWDGCGRRKAVATVAKCDGQIQMWSSNLSQFDQFYI